MISSEIDLIHMISNAGLMVQLVLLLLLVFSITSWAIIFMKFLYFKKAIKESNLFFDYFWQSHDLSAAFVKTKKMHNSPMAKIFRIGFLELQKISKSRSQITQKQDEAGKTENSPLNTKFVGIDNVKRALNRAINTEKAKMVQHVPFLATTGNTAPFIGLFGTVWGIMNSFHSIGMKGSANLAVVAPGISEALVATAVGLVVAIPGVISFNHFMNKIQMIESELYSFADDFLNILERDILRTKVSK